MPNFNSRIIQKLIKYYTHCKKHYHIKNKCNQLFDRSRNNNNNNSDNNNDSDNDGDNRGRRNNNSDNKSKDKGDKDKNKFLSKKRRRNFNAFDSQREIIIIYMTETNNQPTRWAMNYVYL